MEKGLGFKLLGFFPFPPSPEALRPLPSTKDFGKHRGHGFYVGSNVVSFFFSFLFFMVGGVVFHSPSPASKGA